MHGNLAQFAGSLAAVVALVLLVWRLGLGGAPEIADEAEARELADNAVCGFAAVEIGLDRARQGAMLRDEGGRIVLLAPHGNRFVGRLLDGRAQARAEGDTLTVRVGERRLRPVTLELADAAAWCRAIDALG